MLYAGVEAGRTKFLINICDDTYDFIITTSKEACSNYSIVGHLKETFHVQLTLTPM